MKSALRRLNPDQDIKTPARVTFLSTTRAPPAVPWDTARLYFTGERLTDAEVCKGTPNTAFRTVAQSDFVEKQILHWWKKFIVTRASPNMDSKSATTLFGFVWQQAYSNGRGDRAQKITYLQMLYNEFIREYPDLNLSLESRLKLIAGDRGGSKGLRTLNELGGWKNPSPRSEGVQS